MAAELILSTLPKTWILDPRAPKVEKPEIIQNIHEKLMKSLNM